MNFYEAAMFIFENDGFEMRGISGPNGVDFPDDQGHSKRAYWRYPGILCWVDGKGGTPIVVTKELLEARWEYTKID